MIFSEAQTKSLERDWKEFAKGEDVRLEVIGGVLYAFTSELGALRIYYTYAAHAAKENAKEISKYKVDYSINMKSWFFRLN